MFCVGPCCRRQSAGGPMVTASAALGRVLKPLKMKLQTYKKVLQNMKIYSHCCSGRWPLTLSQVLVLLEQLSPPLSPYDRSAGGIPAKRFTMNNKPSLFNNWDLDSYFCL
ncbi:hypothetical protein GOODEAATRI_027764 [Goodea atripinnis]|uniref:Uncharacterized protein n=1 Tax=Goodea atripinnis TaxID=208336 RepID=A0ABV0NNS8_9TELE